MVKDNQVLLAIKVKKIGQGCWNGYGGGIEDKETPEQCIARELSQEARIETMPEDFCKVAIISFHNTKADGTKFTCKVHVYLLYRWEGQAQETEEMKTPTWFYKDRLPLEDMMPADREWLPLILNGCKIIAEVSYGPFQKTLLQKVSYQEVDSFAQ